jgi:hypothetical protein
MRKTLWILAFVAIAAICAPAAHADTLTTYNITFTGGSPNPTMGSFKYDSTNPQFSNFTVIWDGITFDLTSSANSPTSFGTQCNGLGSGANASFGFLSGSKACAPTPHQGISRYWYADGEIFQFLEVISTGGFYIYAGSATPKAASTTGTWTIAAVPEPSSVILMSTALLAMAFGGLKRIVQGLHKTS